MRGNKRRTNVYIDTDLHRKMRKALIDEDRSFSSWVEEQMRLFLQGNGTITQDTKTYKH